MLTWHGDEPYVLSSEQRVTKRCARSPWPR
jgi:hypothetical protein